MELFQIILPLIAGIIVSAIATWAMIRINVADIPGQRSSHSQVTPKCGGVGILCGLMASLIVAYINNALILSPLVLAITSGALAMSCIGLIDDLSPISSKWRLLIQFAIALIITSFLPLQTISLPGINELNLGVIGPVLGLVWIIGYTNAFNFMDGINGMASGTALISSLFLSLLFIHTLQTNLCIISLALVAVNLGFLPFNFPRAKIFQGDVGSQGMGFLLSTLGLAAIYHTPTQISLITIVLLNLPFCFDTAITLIRRALHKENIMDAHRTHLYQLLNQLGWSHTQVSLLYFAMACVSGICAYLTLVLPLQDHLYLLATSLTFYSAYGFVVLKLAYQKKLLI